MQGLDVNPGQVEYPVNVGQQGLDVNPGQVVYPENVGQHAGPRREPWTSGVFCKCRSAGARREPGISGVSCKGCNSTGRGGCKCGGTVM